MFATKRIFMLLGAGISFVAFSGGAFAGTTAEGSILDNEVAAIYGKACEEFKKGEPKSSARVRVIDKASFAAVDNLSMLDAFRKNSEPQDYTLVVYNLVDNAVEDLSVRTLRQNDTDICVEVTGYVSKRNVMQALQEAEPREETIAPSASGESTVQPESSAGKTEKAAVAEKRPDGKVRLWIEPTGFYNNTSSDKFADIIAKQFDARHIEIADKKENADFVIVSNVLRAKVDPLNSETNRLQMVVAVELEDAEGNRVSTEHQNRFVLFSAEEDEQEVALRLMKKLFENACERISQKIELPTGSSKNTRPFAPIITPGGQQSADN